MESKANETCLKHFLSVYINKTLSDLSSDTQPTEIRAIDHKNFILKKFMMAESIVSMSLKLINIFPFPNIHVKTGALLFDLMKSSQTFNMNFKRLYMPVR